MSALPPKADIMTTLLARPLPLTSLRVHPTCSGFGPRSSFRLSSKHSRHDLNSVRAPRASFGFDWRLHRHRSSPRARNRGLDVAPTRAKRGAAPVDRAPLSRRECLRLGEIKCS